jgi:hypothetical protein
MIGSGFGCLRLEAIRKQSARQALNTLGRSGLTGVSEFIVN